MPPKDILHITMGIAWEISAQQLHLCFTDSPDVKYAVLEIGVKNFEHSETINDFLPIFFVLFFHRSMKATSRDALLLRHVETIGNKARE